MKRYARILAISVGLGCLMAHVPAEAARNGNNRSVDQIKVPVCHATHSEQNPYVLIVVPLMQAFGHVTGEPHGPNGQWPDILPNNYGLNGDYFDENCQRAEPPSGDVPEDDEAPSSAGWNPQLRWSPARANF